MNPKLKPFKFFFSFRLQVYNIKYLIFKITDLGQSTVPIKIQRTNRTWLWNFTAIPKPYPFLFVKKKKNPYPFLSQIKITKTHLQIQYSLRGASKTCRNSRITHTFPNFQFLPRCWIPNYHIGLILFHFGFLDPSSSSSVAAIQVLLLVRFMLSSFNRPTSSLTIRSLPISQIKTEIQLGPFSSSIRTSRIRISSFPFPEIQSGCREIRAFYGAGYRRKVQARSQNWERFVWWNIPRYVNNSFRSSFLFRIVMIIIDAD